MSSTEAPEKNTPDSPKNQKSSHFLANYFKIYERNSSWSQEFRGGLATFFAMSYIIVLNPLILGFVPDANNETLGVKAVTAGTALVSGLITIVMGVWAKQPFALAAGLGINGFVSATILQKAQDGLTWGDLMGLIVVTGITMAVLVLTKFREAVFNAVPQSLKMAIVVGVGLFIALIGFVNAGFVRRIPDKAGTTVPVGLGIDGHLLGWPTLVFIIGLVITITLVILKVKGGILISIIVTTVIALIVQAFTNTPPQNDGKGNYDPTGWSLVTPSLPQGSWVSMPDLSLVGKVNPLGAFESIGIGSAMLLAFSILLSIFFDTMGTTMGLATEAKTIDKNGKIDNLNRVLFVDALGVATGGLASSSSNQVYVESGAGIREGARTGFASVVTGALLLVTLFFTPVVGIVPFEAVAPTLVVVGFMMATQVVNIEWKDWSVALPAFLTFVLMPFTYSIATGIGAGFISYVFIKVVQGKWREVHPLMYFVAIAFLVFFSLGVIEQGFGN